MSRKKIAGQKKVVSPTGLEPMTPRTPVRCSKAPRDSWRSGAYTLYMQSSCMTCVLLDGQGIASANHAQLLRKVFHADLLTIT